MRWNTALLVLGLLVAGVPVAHAQGPSAPAPSIEGLWLDELGEGKIEVAPCGEHLCGTIVWLLEPHDDTGRERRDDENPDPALRERKVLGLRVLKDVSAQPDKKGYWRGGRIYDPKNGKTYRCTLSLDKEGNMKLRGFIGISLIGRNSFWTRVTENEP
jgi:uncharacterized protein (DUF2147 family)